MHFIEQVFGVGCNLYTDVLSISINDDKSELSITKADLRKAYYRSALKHHPDKNPTNAHESSKRFQAITTAYQLLQNDEFREEYNRTKKLPSIDNDYNDDDFNDSDNKAGVDMWKDYFSSIFGTITTSKIDEFAAKYKCSEEECRDVLKEFKLRKGDLTKMIQCVILSDAVDAKRWVEDFIIPAIEQDDTLKIYESTMTKTLLKIEKQIESDKNKKNKNDTSRKRRRVEDAKTANDKNNSSINDENDTDEGDDNLDDIDGSDVDRNTTDDDNDDDEETETDVSNEKSRKKPSPELIAKNKQKSADVGRSNSTPKTNQSSTKKSTKTPSSSSSSKKTIGRTVSNNKKKNTNDITDLVASIQARRGGGNGGQKNNSESSFRSFAARYGVVDDDPIGNDEDFAKLQENLINNKKERIQSRSGSKKK